MKNTVCTFLAFVLLVFPLKVPVSAQDTAFFGEEKPLIDAYQLNDITPAAGDTADESTLSLDQALEMEMPDKWSLSMEPRRSYLRSDGEYEDKTAVGGDMPSGNVIIGIGLDYEF